MADGITAPVGDPRRGARNNRPDVITVELLLNMWISFGALKGRVPKTLATGGRMTDEMIQAIGTFQRVVVGLRNPDFRIDPNRRTWQALTAPVTETPAGIRTEQRPRQFYEKRIQSVIRRGDRVIGWVKTPRPVDFDPDFDIFVANVAHTFRDRLVYRTDGGKFARGLVRQSPDIKVIHDLLLALSHVGSAPLQAVFYRRIDPKAGNRWVLHIRFVYAAWEEEEFDFEGINTNILAAHNAKMMEAANQALKGIHGGEIGNRVKKMVDIADAAGYPDNERLWIYTPQNAVDFANPDTPRSKIERMARAGGGEPPFDGYIGPQEGVWRVHVFGGLARFLGYRERTMDDTVSVVTTWLAEYHRLIFHQTFGEIKKFTGGKMGMAGGSQMLPIQQRFLDDLGRLQRDSKHLYSAFRD